MIDWLRVVLDSLWIFGLALILAAFSYHRWLAGETSRRGRDVLAQSSWKLSFSLGMVLICVGVGYGLVGRWWERILWTALALWYARQFIAALQTRSKTVR